MDPCLILNQKGKKPTKLKKKKKLRHLVVKSMPCSAEDTGLIPVKEVRSHVQQSN